MILEIAIKSNVTVGKWMIFKQRTIVDETWQKIAEATVAGKLGCTAKVSYIMRIYIFKGPSVHTYNSDLQA